MKTLWLLQYNNYYNRIVKREETLADYQVYQVKFKGIMQDPNGNTAVLQNVNFIEGDFVNTTQVVNWGGDLPDYLLVIDENQQIESRWFVVSSEKMRGGQLSLQLHRDLVVDFYDATKDADMFVEKATLNDSSPLIYNAEGMSFNQIKTRETLIKDDSKCPWIILYTDQKTRLQADIAAIDYNISITYNSPSEFYNSPIYQVYGSRYQFIGDPNSMEYTKWRFYLDYNNSARGVAPFFEFENMKFNKIGAGLSAHSNHLKTLVNESTGFDIATLTQMVLPGVEKLKQNNIGFIESLKRQGFWVDATVYNDCKGLSNQIIKVIQTDGSAKYYRVICTPSNSTNQLYASVEDQDVWYAIKSQGISLGILQSSQAISPTNELYMSVDGYTISLQEISVQTLSLDILPFSYTNDSPYNILAIPFSDELKIKNSLATGFTEVTSNKSLALQIAKNLILSYAGANALYDAQILPYCPLASSIVDSEENILDINSTNATDWVPVQSSDGKTYGYVFRISFSSFNRYISLGEPIDIKNKKIEAETDIYRLSSPNFSSMFEFNAAKNNGIQGFSISCTYKPYSPYIKIRPNFKGLYGSDFDDSRGLILGGDYSLPMTTDAWKTYEMQNKNYQASFDRNILSMEINNNIARQQERWQVAAGVISAGTQAGSAGSMMGGPAGAIVGVGGGIAAGALSLMGGMKDIEFNEALRREAMSLAQDQFGFQLGNIKALPIGLSKTSAYNIDNKYFPFLEFYTATETEKIALAQKIRNNGMTVGVIGKWKEFINNTWSYSPPDETPITDRGYFKAKLISLVGEKMDTHLVNAIANEFFQGVYLR